MLQVSCHARVVMKKLAVQEIITDEDKINRRYDQPQSVHMRSKIYRGRFALICFKVSPSLRRENWNNYDQNARFWHRMRKNNIFE